jgi:excinuclease ABC subunit C
LLQRIRDEAHRFANGFHQLLMKRRIAESLLDECPGVSQHRKALLLQKFGSVIGRAHDALQRVATVATKQYPFLAVRARHAGEPFSIGEL